MANLQNTNTSICANLEKYYAFVLRQIDLEYRLRSERITVAYVHYYSSTANVAGFVLAERKIKRNTCVVLSGLATHPGKLKTPQLPACASLVDLYTVEREHHTSIDQAIQTSNLLSWTANAVVKRPSLRYDCLVCSYNRGMVLTAAT